MPILGPHTDTDTVELFCEYFRSLKLLNYIQSRAPRYFLKPESLVDIDEREEREFISRAVGTGINLDNYRTLLSDYLRDRSSEQRIQVDWRDIEKIRTSPARAQPLQLFIAQHVDDMYKRIATVPAGIDKSWASLRGIVKSGFEGYSDEVYEAYSLLKSEIPKEDVQAVIASWLEERDLYQKNLQYPSALNPPRIFWPNSLAHFVENGIARYRFKCDFWVGAFESAFVEFEEALSDSMKGPIAGDGVRHLAYDLCSVSRSQELVQKLRPSIATALNSLISEQTKPYWSEWSQDSDRIPKTIPSVTTTAFAALALIKLGSSDSVRKRGIEAATWLLENQNIDGSWSLDTQRGSLLEMKPDIHVTLTAVEAIARSGVSGASHHLDQACSWVLSKQDKNGLWEDETFRLPQPTVLVIETFEYLKKSRPEITDTYLAAAIGYFRRAPIFLEEHDAIARRLSVVTAHLAIESFLYSIIQTHNITKIFDKGQTIGMRSALSAFQNWMQQQRHLKPNELLSYSNELGKLAYLRDEIVHKALSISQEDADSVVKSALRFASKYSQALLGFDCMD